MRQRIRFIISGVALCAAVFTLNVNANTHSDHKITQQHAIRYIAYKPFSNFPLSGAVLVGHTLRVSGVGGDIQKNGKMSSDFAKQASQAMNNVGLLLKEGGSSYADVTACQVYLVHMRDSKIFNGIYKTYFKPGRYPARTMVAVKELVGPDQQVEVTCDGVRQ
ncbi:MAG TPA: RidA family protein [Coxiellaceae bacterium]|nr:RidA family protein [Coxiellaceae bacterium]